ncbi:MAG: hypothetical protein NOOUEUKL_002490 [Candidatus Fervidibacter sp.]|jgi:hypothetical protein
MRRKMLLSGLRVLFLVNIFSLTTPQILPSFIGHEVFIARKRVGRGE